jgi:hypothetical protein
LGSARPIKTFGGCAVKQPIPGIYLWRNRYGAIHRGDLVLEWAA